MIGEVVPVCVCVCARARARRAYTHTHTHTHTRKVALYALSRRVFQAEVSPLSLKDFPSPPVICIQLPV